MALPGCFNTQPPEGGWTTPIAVAKKTYCFNTQPPEGGWAKCTAVRITVAAVSTHSRLKAAGACVSLCYNIGAVSTHSRLKAAGLNPPLYKDFKLCFNTQPPEGGWFSFKTKTYYLK